MTTDVKQECSVQPNDRIRNKVLSDIEFIVSAVVLSSDGRRVAYIEVVYQNHNKFDNPAPDGHVAARIPFDVLKRDFVKVVERTEVID